MYKRLTKEEISEINQLWEMFEDLEPDISTERLFSMISAEFNRKRPTKAHIDDGDIAEALAPV